jgi:hypothetical protein
MIRYTYIRHNKKSSSMLFLFIYFLVQINSISTVSGNMNNCNKMWGVTQDANGRMLYKVEMFMCIEDPYNIYKKSYLNALPIPVSNVSLSMIQQNITNITIKNDSFLTHVNTTNATLNNIPGGTFPVIKNTTKNVTINTTKNNTPTSTNLRSQRTDKNNIDTVNNTTDYKVISIIVYISMGVALIIFGSVFYKKRSRKIHQDKEKTLHTVEQSHTRRPTLKPFENNVRTDPKNRANSRTNKLNDVTNKAFRGNKRHELSVNTSGKKLHLNHTALTPNTQQILNESKKSVKKWYKKTFPAELRQSSNDAPLPPSAASKLKMPIPKLDRNVKLSHNNNFAH